MGRIQELRIAASSARYLGLRHKDPICGWRFRKLTTWTPGTPPVVCPRCFSSPRNRTMWLYLTREYGLDRRVRVLHFAPEHGIRRRLQANPLIDYISVDALPGFADITADITALPFDDGAFDLVLCSHVLEHVEDDGAAMRELARVGASALLQHPIDADRPVTYEDPSITSPGGREEAFGQYDHVRIYGRDFTDRLQAAGFDVATIRYREQLSTGERERFALDVPPSAHPEREAEGDVIYVCHARSHVG